MKNFTYIAFGDSLTFGYGIEASYTFVPRLLSSLPIEYKNINFNIINSGVNGDTTREGLLRIKNDVLDYKPNLVTILFGTNDSAYGDSSHRSLGEFKLNYAKIISEIKSIGSKIILITPPPVIEDPIFPYLDNSKLLEYIKIIKDLAENNSIRLIDFNKLLSDKVDNIDKYLQYDGVHLNELGYNELYNAIKNEIALVLNKL